MKNNRFKLKYRFKLLNKRFNHFFPLLLIMIAGYALMQSSVNIKGTLGVVENSWNVYFDNLVVNSESIEAIKPAIISNSNKTSISYEIALKNENDFYEFEVDMVNAGTIDAMISDIKLSGLNNEYKKYITQELTYENNDKVHINDYLEKKSQQRIKVAIHFNNQYNISDFFKSNNVGNNLKLNLSIELVFVQKNEGIVGIPIKTNILGQEMIAYADNKKSPYVTNESGINFKNINSDTNGKGLYLMSDTDSYQNPIYYFRGEVSDNNVIFANKCWKIIRTTETGGTKLIYNGLPSTSGTCNNAVSTPGIGNSAFSGVNYSLSNSSLMVDLSMAASTFSFEKSVTSISVSTNSLPYSPILGVNKTSEYYYSKSYTISGNTYTLDNPTKLGKLEEIYDTFSKEGYYTCFLTNGYSCGNLYYVLPSTSARFYTLRLNNGLTLEQVDAENIVGSDFIKNEDGTYSLSGEISRIKASEWIANMDSLAGKYICSSSNEITCRDMQKITSASATDYKYYRVDDILSEIVFGNDVEWDGTNYILKNTYTKEVGTTWAEIYGKEELINRRYTCLSSSNICSGKIYYIIYSDASFKYYELTNGEKIEDIFDKLLNNSKNARPSLMMKTLDTWYEEELKDFNDYIEDTVWCNDRETYSLGQFNPNLTGKVYFNAYSRISLKKGVSLECANKKDRFTLKRNKKNSNQIIDGNNLLDNPIGLITADEAILGGISSGYANSSSYLYTGTNYWTLTPFYYSADVEYPSSYFYGVLSNGNFASLKNSTSYSVRPSISLHAGVVATSGDGTINSPYIIE